MSGPLSPRSFLPRYAGSALARRPLEVANSVVRHRGFPFATDLATIFRPFGKAVGGAVEADVLVWGVTHGVIFARQNPLEGPSGYRSISGDSSPGFKTGVASAPACMFMLQWMQHTIIS